LLHVVETAAEAFEFIKNTPDLPNVCLPGSSGLLCQDGTADWKIFRIMAELVEGFEFLTKIPENVTVLGTKSTLPDSPYYRAAYALGKILAQNKLAVETGGGPGIMEAASKGSFENGGQSIGVNMQFEQGIERRNAYLTHSASFFFPFVRKMVITYPSRGFVFFPGGFGTLHQLFEILTLQETKKTPPIPTLLYGSNFWEPLLKYIHQVLREQFKTIGVVDEQYVRVVNSPEEVMAALKK